MVFVADTINLREIVMKEPLPLTTIQNAVIDFVRGRDDVVLFGAQAVNVYVNEPRATNDGLFDHFSTSFHICTFALIIFVKFFHSYEHE